jgi:hypothetical protein
MFKVYFYNVDSLLRLMKLNLFQERGFHINAELVQPILLWRLIEVCKEVADKNKQEQMKKSLGDFVYSKENNYMEMSFIWQKWI